jgi:hypothetical protein
MSDLAGIANPIQTESTRFRSSVSEALMQQIGGNINYLLAAVMPIGSYCDTDLTEAQFQDLAGDGWELADGGDCTGSQYAILTGNTTKPNAMGIFRRGKNNGRSTGTGNAAGERALGEYEADTIKSHTHPVTASYLPETGGPIVHDDGSEFANSAVSNTGANAGAPAETRPRNITCNVMFRIN